MIYEVKLNIKKYATLNIYTTSENIKNKLIAVVILFFIEVVKSKIIEKVFKL